MVTQRCGTSLSENSLPLLARKQELMEGVELQTARILESMGLSWTLSAGVMESTACGKCKSATGVESMACGWSLSAV